MVSCGVGRRCGSDLVFLRLWCSSNSTPSLGTSICLRCGPRKQKKRTPLGILSEAQWDQQCLSRDKGLIPNLVQQLKGSGGAAAAAYGSDLIPGAETPCAVGWPEKKKKKRMARKSRYVTVMDREDGRGVKGTQPHGSPGKCKVNHCRPARKTKFQRTNSPQLARRRGSCCESRNWFTRLFIHRH